MNRFQISAGTLEWLARRIEQDPETVFRYPGRYTSPPDRILILTNSMLIGYQQGMSDRFVTPFIQALDAPWVIGVRLAQPQQAIFREDLIQWASTMPELETLATIPSRRSQKTIYTVKRDPQSGSITCDCPGWIYSKRDPRSCRHTLVFEALMSNEAIKPGVAVETKPPVRILTDEEVRERLDRENTPAIPDPDIPAVAVPRLATALAREYPVGTVWKATVSGAFFRVEGYNPNGSARVLFQDKSKGNFAASTLRKSAERQATGGEVATYLRQIGEAPKTRAKATKVTVEAQPGVRLRAITFEDDED